MVSSFLAAFFQLALPVGILTYLVVGYLLAENHLPAFENRRALRTGLSGLKKTFKKKKLKNPVIAKWFEFGGGFYGLVAAFTYALIEIDEIIGFLVKMADPANWTFDISVGLLVSLIIETVKNLITAALWFTYWPPDFTFFNLVLWMGLAYGGYMLGGFVARDHARDGQGFARWWAERKTRRRTDSAQSNETAGEG